MAEAARIDVDLSFAVPCQLSQDLNELVGVMIYDVQ